MAEKNKGGRPTGSRQTEADKKCAEILKGNIEKIVNYYSSSRAEFILEHMYSLTGDKRKVVWFKGDNSEVEMQTLQRKMERLLGGQQPSYQELLTLSNLAGVSINELLTTELDFDSKPSNLRDILVTLFTLLDKMHFETKEIKSELYTGYVFFPMLKPQTQTSEGYHDFMFGHIINEFLREYLNHKNAEDYSKWRREIIKGAYAYTSDGHKIQEREPLPEIKQIVENAHKAMQKVTEAYRSTQTYFGYSLEEWNRIPEEQREAIKEREEYESTHPFFGYTEAEWAAFTEEAREAIVNAHEEARLEANAEGRSRTRHR